MAYYFNTTALISKMIKGFTSKRMLRICQYLILNFAKIDYLGSLEFLKNCLN